MTPFGEKLRALRAARGLRQADMAKALEISAAYLSALEHGKRGAPSAGLIHQICQYFDLIWDDADELKQLARLQAPRAAQSLGADGRAGGARQPAGQGPAGDGFAGRGSDQPGAG
jgi:transcriptional regulator with XRE-family HTH domain